MTGLTFDRARLIELLTEVGAAVAAAGKHASIYVVGGAAMALEFESRRVTRDVNAVLRRGDITFWEAVAAVAARHGLPADWINTNATAFLPDETDDDATEFSVPGLTVASGSAEHLLAMKLRALRDRDIDDLVVLFRHLGLESPEQAVAIHDRLFDESAIGYLPADEIRYAAQLVLDRMKRG